MTGTLMGWPAFAWGADTTVAAFGSHIGGAGRMCQGWGSQARRADPRDRASALSDCDSLVLRALGIGVSARPPTLGKCWVWGTPPGPWQRGLPPLHSPRARVGQRAISAKMPPDGVSRRRHGGRIL